ncbi:succinylglutamate desuccinylase/aspartoacylase family protein [Paraburkholderia dilworthii]|uniref:succinylglutamate desuccinylase/aspartoacylase family protein n=1 Tax=Paraburkholderia dilworthii TaxID=948106 RepID=UPI00047FEF72|nr:succinylglutamate desuccinylase/aspartoacylase family protein [Paraburkholderia dilworthii]
MAQTTRIWTPIDFELDGKQTGSLRLPISSDLSAYGWIPIPLVCIKNGDGPTAVLIAGTHGDEYEGQIALLELARSIEPSEVHGRIIILPALNFPAVEAGRRVSPLDEGNLNRLYPGEAHGTATQMIAHYMATVLLPMADLVVDLHSGGRSLDYVPCALVRPFADNDLDDRQMTMLRIFGAPFSCVTDGKGGGGDTTLPATAEKLGVPVITAELGGGAMLRSYGKELARLAVLRLLDHIDLRVDGALPQPEQTRVMVGGRGGFLYAEAEGLFEPASKPGDEVTAGQHAGYLHSIERPTEAPVGLVFNVSGVVACRRFPTLTRRGDCLYTVMQDFEPAERQ